MKTLSLTALLALLLLAACKKDTSTTTPPATISFDFEGSHHSFTLNQLQLQTVDTGAAKGKFLSINTGTTAFPQVQFVITDRSTDYTSPCFSTGTYPSLAGNTACHDSIGSNFCVGFFMQYTDTGVGVVGLWAVPDSTSLLTLASCSGGTSTGTDVINGTFSAVLTDSTGFITPKHVTNGVLSNVRYTHK